MKIGAIKEILDAEVIYGEHLMDYDVSCAFASDLMSDVLAYVKGKAILLTGLLNAQVIRTAEMADLNVIVFVRGKKPSEEIINLAMENNIVLLRTKDTMYVASGKLYCSGLSGITVE